MNRSIAPGFVVVWLGADLDSAPIDRPSGFGEFGFGHSPQVVDLLTKLLLPGRRVGERDQIPGSSIEVGKLVSGVGLFNVPPDRLVDMAKIRFVVDFTVDMVF